MPDLVGQTLGKYQLIERLGRGGMADVYKAYQPGLDRHVAVKVMHPHLSEDPDFITRFNREAKSVANLRHRHIMQVFDFDSEGESYYMVMEYIEGGRTLKEVLQELAAKRQRLSIKETLNIVAIVADALDYAHGVGMIHRDIKPANILMPKNDHPMLGDFGIARLMGQTGLTSTGAMVGTPAYMSPEQGRGERGDERSDIYALGIVLYEMLTGKPPYDADTPFAVILKHINDPLVPPHDLIDSLPDAVERIVLRSLAKNADDRFATGAAMHDALRAAYNSIDDAQPTPAPVATRITAPVTAATVQAQAQARPVVAADPAMPTEPPASLLSRLPVPLWAIGLAAVVLVGVVILVVSTQGSDIPTSDIPASAATVSDAPASDAPASDEPSRSGPSISNPEALPFIREGYEYLFEGDIEAALEEFEEVLEDDPDNANALVGRAVAELSWYGDFDAAAADLERAEDLVPGDPFLHYGFGLLYDRGEGYFDPEESEEEYTLAIESCGDLEVLCVAALTERAAVRAWTLDDIGGGLADINRAIERQPGTEDNPYLYDMRGDFHLARGDVESAVLDFELAYELSDDGFLLEKAAFVSVKHDDFERALAVYERLLNEQAGDPYFLVGQGYVQLQVGDLEAAQESASHALELDPELLGAHYLLGLVLMESDAAEEALGEFEIFAAETEDDIDRYWEASQPFFQTDLGHEVYYDMARAARNIGDWELALEFAERSLEIHDYWAWPYVLKGEILAELGELQAARENLLQAQEFAGDDEELLNTINELLVDLSQ